MGKLQITKHDLEHIRETVKRIEETYDFEIDGTSEIIMLSFGYADVNVDGGVTVHNVCYEEDDLEVVDDDDDDDDDDAG